MNDLNKMIERIDSYRYLEKNWNWNGADTPPEALIDKAIKLIKELSPVPETFLTANNSIQFEWEKGSLYTEMEVFEDKIELFVESELSNGNKISIGDGEKEVDDRSDYKDNIRKVMREFEFETELIEKFLCEFDDIYEADSSFRIHIGNTFELDEFNRYFNYNQDSNEGNVKLSPVLKLRRATMAYRYLDKLICKYLSNIKLRIHRGGK